MLLLVIIYELSTDVNNTIISPTLKSIKCEFHVFHTGTLLTCEFIEVYQSCSTNEPHAKLARLFKNKNKNKIERSSI